jgi:5-methylcytosine-specific restriction endonuclease McrA
MDRERGKRNRLNPEASQRRITIERASVNKGRMRRVAEWLIKNEGAHCLFMWHICSKCSGVRPYKNTPYSDTLCRRCRRFENERGSTWKMIEREVKCAKCGHAHIGKVEGAMCEPCNAVNKRVRRRGRKKGRLQSGGHRARARRYGVPYESVSRKVVYDRDEWTCYLCGVVVVRSSTYRDDQASIDHVLPLSKGGPHTYSNVKTCCMLCNSTKGDKREWRSTRGMAG